MRVVLVSLARRGGMVHFLAEVAGGLAPLTDLVAIISARARVDYLPAGIKTLAVETGAGRLSSLARLMSPLNWHRLSSQLRALRPEIVHIVGSHEWNPLISLICRSQGVPLVYTVHDPESHPGTPWTIRAGDWLTRRLASQLVTLTRVGRQQLLRRGERLERVAVVPHPMYTLFRRWRPRPARSEKIILYFGRLEAYKGLGVLVQAFCSVQPSLPGWKLVIAGEGKLPQGLGDGTRASIEVIHGYVPDKEVARLFSRSSIVALPYTSATQSGVIALAQAFARPVVATAVGGLGEMVVEGRTGLLVRPGNPAAFGKALQRLAGDPARRARMQHEIRVIAAVRWAPRTVAKAYIQVYKTFVRNASTK